MKKFLTAGLGLGVLGAGASAIYGLAHAHSYRVRRRSLLVPHSDGEALRIVHISDAHTLARHAKRLTFLRKLGEMRPDLVVLTGDMISEDAALEPVLDALDPLLDVPGVFVFGSNDYLAPRFRNPFGYLVSPSNVGSDSSSAKTRELRWREMRAAFEERGWLNLNNQRGRLDVCGWTLDFVGVDDPHLDYDAFPAPDSEAVPASGPYARIGVTHAPYTRVLDAMVDDGCSLIFAGHTHGGQVCLPGGRALVTNCDLDTEFASGLFTWPRDDHGSAAGAGGEPDPSGQIAVLKGDGAVISHSQPGSRAAGSAWVQVSAGIGTSPYAPVRTFCPPEAIVLDVIPFRD
ncbi:metallophosphoesterase [Trueperella bialowiezensis]|uniref:metallophosphoesterase n=1 Tax=Trueperella bialowiezensis TaxID=312285 RepID=UPI0013E00E74|nr:metallophosphoesterase [Trueperella bialowiezensis]